MKTLLKAITYFLIILSSNFISAQVTVETVHVNVNGNLIPNCGTIDLETNTTTNVSLWIKLSKNTSHVVGDGNLYIYRKNSVSSTIETEVLNKQIPSSAWLLPTEYNTTENIVLNYDDFSNTSGGVIFIRYVSSGNSEYDSCNMNVIKDEKPTFTMPSSTTVACNSTASKTFTVTNVYNSPGNLSFNWEIGNGWLFNGNSVSNFTTTTNSISLVPTAFPPSNVSVTPVLDGVSYPKLTTSVSLSELTVGEISGSTQSCVGSNNTFSISNVPSNANVTWTLTPSNIANIVSTTSNSVTLNGTFNGVAILRAVVSNSCGQTKTRIKSIQVGGPVVSGVSEIDPSSILHLYSFKPDCLVGLKLNLFPSSAGILNYEWQKISNNFQWSKDFAPNVNDDKIIINTNSNTTISFKVRVQDNLCGWSNWKTINYNITSCGSSNNGGGSSNGGINSNNFSIYPVPVSNILHIDIQSISGPFLLNSGDIYTIKLFKTGVGYVRQITSNTSNAQIDVNGLASGLYILEIHYNNIYESHGILIN